MTLSFIPHLSSSLPTISQLHHSDANSTMHSTNVSKAANVTQSHNEPHTVDVFTDPAAALPSTVKCHCYHSKTSKKHSHSSSPHRGRYDHHEMCTLAECHIKKCTDSHVSDYFESFREWKDKVREIEAKIEDSAQTVHLSMLQLALRLYLCALTGRVSSMTPTKLRGAYSRFKNLLDSFTSQEICEELLRRFSTSQDCVVALLARCWIRAHTMQQSHEASEIVSLLINSHTLTNREKCFAHFTRGRLEHMYLGDVDLALKDYNISIESYDQFSDVYNNRGNIYADYFGDADRALSDYNKAIELDTSFYLAYDNRGELYEEEFCNLSHALADYTLALKYNPLYMTAHQNRVNLLFRINKTTMIGNL